MSHKSIFSQNLTKARKQRNWSQEGAATAIKKAGAENFKTSLLSSYEEGRAHPNFQTLLVICKVYEIEDLKAFISEMECEKS